MVGQRNWSNSLCDWVLSKTLNCLIREGELLLMVGQRGIEASLTSGGPEQDGKLPTEGRVVQWLVPDKTRNCPYW